MKRNRMFALMVLALSGTGVAQAAEVGDFSNSWYFAPRLGVVAPDGDRDTKSSLFTGLGLGWWVSPNLAVDLEWSLNNADYKRRSFRHNHEWESVGLDVAGRYYFGDIGSGWRPYIMGGIGALRHAPVSGIIRHSGWDPMVTLGAGLHYNFSERIAFRGELAARYDRDNNSPRRHGDHDGTGFIDAILSAGLVINFGGGAEPEPVDTTTPAAPPSTSCRDLDDDKDGVNNCDDQCPGTPAGTLVGPDGCPQKVVIDLRGVNFKFDRPKRGEKNIEPSLQEPTAESLAILEQAVDTLKRYPDIRVEVAGHTDAIGTDEYNQGLSERRAQIVYDYLTSHGIDSSRLDSPKGYGESKPIDTNDTREGRARNRRTELTVE